MAFNINTFKSKMDLYGGPARTNLFMVNIYGADSSFMNDQDLRFFCRTATIPGINLGVMEYRPNTFGLPESMPIAINSESMNCMFLLDSGHMIMSFFHEWMNNIVNFDTSRGYAPNRRDSNHLPYEINYKSDYAVRMSIMFYSSENREDRYYLCELDGVYPTQIGSLNLSWDENDTAATLPVNFSYNRIHMQALDRNSLEGTESSTGVSLMDYYATLGNRGEVYQSSFINENSILPRTERSFSALL